MASSGGLSANLTATSAVMGSPLYMSPEQVRNAKQVDARADIWSLGVILHELLTGSPVFQADTLPGICAAIIADEPPPLRSLREDAPAELEAVVTRCLEKSVRSRFQTTRDLMLALRNFASTGMRQNVSDMPVAPTMKEAGISSRNPQASGPQPSSKPASAQDRGALSDQKTQVQPSGVALPPDRRPRASLVSSAVAGSFVEHRRLCAGRSSSIAAGHGNHCGRSSRCGRLRVRNEQGSSECAGRARRDSCCRRRPHRESRS